MKTDFFNVSGSADLTFKAQDSDPDLRESTLLRNTVKFLKKKIVYNGFQGSWYLVHHKGNAKMLDEDINNTRTSFAMKKLFTLIFNVYYPNREDVPSVCDVALTYLLSVMSYCLMSPCTQLEK
jgi:hypothetical protein